MNLLPSKTVVVLLIFGVALLFWVSRQPGIAEVRREIDAAQSELGLLHERHAAAAEALATAKQDLSEEQTARAAAVATLNLELKELAKVDPETRWSASPILLPEWNPESPYVWIRKEMVPRIAASPFGEDGSLGPEAAHVLVIDAPVMRELNRRLKQAISDYRDVEATEARLSEEHLPGIANSPGDKITATIKPPPEQGARYRLEVETALRELIGEQRASMVMALGANWLSGQFSNSGTEPKTISVIRRPGGSYTISIKSGGNWFSTGGSWKNIEPHIPPAARPLFADFCSNEPGTQ
jgi:hypothetical protein